MAIPGRLLRPLALFVPNRLWRPLVALASKRSSRVLSPIKNPRHQAGKMAIPGRFERSTYCLEGSCSIQLSYGTNVFIIAHFSKIVNKKESQMADKPGSVKRAIIRLAMSLLTRSSNLPSDDEPETVLLQRKRRPSYLVLLPIGFVLPQGLSACAVSSYLAISPLPMRTWAVYFL